MSLCKEPDVACLRVNLNNYLLVSSPFAASVLETIVCRTLQHDRDNEGELTNGRRSSGQDHSDRSTKPMRFLFCLTFWLSVVVYNLPSLESGPAPSEPRKTTNIRRSTDTSNANAHAKFCGQNWVACAHPAGVVTRLGDQPANRPSSKLAQMTTQNTLRFTDLAPPWRGVQR